MTVSRNFKPCRQLVNLWEDVKECNFFHWKLPGVKLEFQMVEGKKRNSRREGRRGLTILEFGGHGVIFPKARGGGGVEMFMPPVVWYGYFLESPNSL